MDAHPIATTPQLFVVAPAYNEQAGIAGFVQEVGRVCQGVLAPVCQHTELIVVDDGSTDETFQAALVAGAGSPAFHVRVLALSRNFGQQAAIQAGLADAFHRSQPGDLFVVMDSDLQHPPDLLPSIVAALHEGCDHVQMLRRDAASLPWGKKTASASFYWALRHLAGLPLSAGSSDFRGMNHAFLKAYLRLCEVGRFNRGLFYWVGFERRDIVYQAATRAVGGSKYTLRRMVALALTGITQFSSRPLILLCSAIVLASFLFCAAYVAWEIYRYAHGHRYVLGWPTLVFFITFWSGSIALIQLVTAIYLARVFDEVKGRPAFIVRRSGGGGGA